MKAADIPDQRIYEVVASGHPSVSGSIRSAVTTSDVCAELPDVPWKVIRAKLAQMVAKGRLSGCACGCRGDFRFPWVEFGDPVDSENWQERICEYLKGPRKIGY